MLYKLVFREKILVTAIVSALIVSIIVSSTTMLASAYNIYNTYRLLDSLPYTSAYMFASDYSSLPLWNTSLQQYVVSVDIGPVMVKLSADNYSLYIISLPRIDKAYYIPYASTIDPQTITGQLIPRLDKYDPTVFNRKLEILYGNWAAERIGKHISTLVNIALLDSVGGNRLVAVLPRELVRVLLRNYGTRKYSIDLERLRILDPLNDKLFRKYSLILELEQYSKVVAGRNRFISSINGYDTIGFIYTKYRLDHVVSHTALSTIHNAIGLDLVLVSKLADGTRSCIALYYDYILDYISDLVELENNIGASIFLTLAPVIAVSIVILYYLFIEQLVSSETRRLLLNRGYGKTMVFTRIWIAYTVLSIPAYTAGVYLGYLLVKQSVFSMYAKARVLDPIQYILSYIPAIISMFLAFKRYNRLEKPLDQLLALHGVGRHRITVMLGLLSLYFLARTLSPIDPSKLLGEAVETGLTIVVVLAIILNIVDPLLVFLGPVFLVLFVAHILRMYWRYIARALTLPFKRLNAYPLIRGLAEIDGSHIVIAVVGIGFSLILIVNGLAGLNYTSSIIGRTYSTLSPTRYTFSKPVIITGKDSVERIVDDIQDVTGYTPLGYIVVIYGPLATNTSGSAVYTIVGDNEVSASNNFTLIEGDYRIYNLVLYSLSQPLLPSGDHVLPALYIGDDYRVNKGVYSLRLYRDKIVNVSIVEQLTNPPLYLYSIALNIRENMHGSIGFTVRYVYPLRGIGSIPVIYVNSSLLLDWNMFNEATSNLTSIGRPLLGLVIVYSEASPDKAMATREKGFYVIDWDSEEESINGLFNYIVYGFTQNIIEGLGFYLLSLTSYTLSMGVVGDALKPYFNTLRRRGLGYRRVLAAAMLSPLAVVLVAGVPGLAAGLYTGLKSIELFFSATASYSHVEPVVLEEMYGLASIYTLDYSVFIVAVLLSLGWIVSPAVILAGRARARY